MSTKQFLLNSSIQRLFFLVFASVVLTLIVEPTLSNHQTILMLSSFSSTTFTALLLSILLMSKTDKPIRHALIAVAVFGFCSAITLVWFLLRYSVYFDTKYILPFVTFTAYVSFLTLRFQCMRAEAHDGFIAIDFIRCFIYICSGILLAADIAEISFVEELNLINNLGFFIAFDSALGIVKKYIPMRTT